jgi:hypothetical protein
MVNVTNTYGYILGFVDRFRCTKEFLTHEFVSFSRTQKYQKFSPLYVRKEWVALPCVKYIVQASRFGSTLEENQKILVCTYGCVNVH